MGSSHSTSGCNLPWKTTLKLFLISAVTSIVRRRNGTLHRRLLSLVEFDAKPNRSPVHGVRTADYTIDPVRGLWFRLFVPAAPVTTPQPVVVFFHGGGFAFCSPATREYDALCRQLCRKVGVAVVSVNYRLTPEHRFPAQYEDGYDVLRLLESTKAGGFFGKDLILREFFQTADLSSCFLAGDSAGANIAHHVATRWSAGLNHHVRLVGLLAIQPFFGGEARVDSEIRRPGGPLVTIERSDWMWKAFLPKGATRDHPAANPQAAAEGLSESFPPVLVVVGELDPLHDWQWEYFRSLIKNGKEAEIIEYPGAIHAFYIFPELRHSSDLIKEMRSFILRQIRRRRGGGPVEMRKSNDRTNVS